MDRTELIVKAAALSGETKAAAERVLLAILETIETELVGGGKVLLRGFGSFYVKPRKAREGKNPRTGETIQIAAKRLAKANLTFDL